MLSSSSRAASGEPSSTNTTAGSAPNRCIAAASSMVKLSAPPIWPLHKTNTSLTGRSSPGCLATAKTGVSVRLRFEAEAQGYYERSQRDNPGIPCEARCP